MVESDSWMDTSVEDAGFDIIEATITEIHDAFESSELTAEQLTEEYINRIRAHDETLNAVLHINETARDRAQELDERFATNGLTGPLHGIPTLIKDNHDTESMPTTAGSELLEDVTPPRSAFVVEQLRDAGAIIIGKTNLQELSFGTDTVSSLGGNTRNPYAVEHRPSGSSGGTAAAVAANLSTIGTGTDTCSSVRSPPSFTNLVGVRPTSGLVSRTGLIPLSTTQDTAGPIARTVGDAARTLEAMAGYDPMDPSTATGLDEIPEEGYTDHLISDGLEDARIGVLRNRFEPTDERNASSEAFESIRSCTETAIDAIESAGATVIDPFTVADPDRIAASRVVAYEFKRDFNAYLSEIGEASPIDSLQELVDSGTLTESVGRRIHETGSLEVDTDTLDRDPEYLAALVEQERLRTQIVHRLTKHDLDAVLYPPSTVPPIKIPDSQPFEEMRCQLAAHSGLPAIVVRSGFTNDGLPVGVELLGRPFDEARLFELAYAYEQATDHRTPPSQFS